MKKEGISKRRRSRIIYAAGIYSGVKSDCGSAEVFAKPLSVSGGFYMNDFSLVY